jgi:hypothetical protein
MNNNNYCKICRKGGKIEKACDVYISKPYMGSGWNLNRSKWALPVELESASSCDIANADAYKKHLQESSLIHQIHELAYQTLGCWCKNFDSCHAHVLATLVNDYLSQSPRDSSGIPELVITKVPVYKAEHSRLKRQVIVKKKVKKLATETQTEIKVHITSPIVCNNPPEPITKITDNYTVIAPYKPPPYNDSMFIRKQDVKPGVAKGFALNLHNSKTWDPFVCYIAKIIRNKKTERYMFILSEQPSNAANNKNSVKVHVASQLYPAIHNKTFAKDDLIYVEHYAITHVGPKKHIIIVCHAEKFT